MSLPLQYYATAGGGTTTDATASSDSPIHPAVVQHLLQQHQQHQLALLQMQAAQQGGYAAAALAAPPPPPPAVSLAPFAGAPLMQAAAMLPQIGPQARSDSASSASASSSVENAQPTSSSSPSTSKTESEVVRLHISNIPYKWRDPDLRKLFEQHGKVVEAEVIFNERGSKGFGFVTMANKEGADAAKAAVHHQNFENRIVEVNPATVKLSGRQKAKVLQAATAVVPPYQQHMQLALLQQQQQPMLQPQLGCASADPMQQLLAAQAILTQYAAQQQMLQQVQQQQQQWLLQPQLGAAALPPAAAAHLDMDKYQRRMAEEMARRYKPY